MKSLRNTSSVLSNIFLARSFYFRLFLSWIRIRDYVVIFFLLFTLVYIFVRFACWPARELFLENFNFFSRLRIYEYIKITHGLPVHLQKYRIHNNGYMPAYMYGYRSHRYFIWSFFSGNDVKIKMKTKIYRTKFYNNYRVKIYLENVYKVQENVAITIFRYNVCGTAKTQHAEAVLYDIYVINISTIESRDNSTSNIIL